MIRFLRLALVAVVIGSLALTDDTRAVAGCDGVAYYVQNCDGSLSAVYEQPTHHSHVHGRCGWFRSRPAAHDGRVITAPGVAIAKGARRAGQAVVNVGRAILPPYPALRGGCHGGQCHR